MPVPFESKWRSAEAPDGRVYFWNVDTRETAWAKPEEHRPAYYVGEQTKRFRRTKAEIAAGLSFDEAKRRRDGRAQSGALSAQRKSTVARRPKVQVDEDVVPGFVVRAKAYVDKRSRKKALEHVAADCYSTVSSRFPSTINLFAYTYRKPQQRRSTPAPNNAAIAPGQRKGRNKRASSGGNAADNHGSRAKSARTVDHPTSPEDGALLPGSPLSPGGDGASATRRQAKRAGGGSGRKKKKARVGPAAASAPASTADGGRHGKQPAPAPAKEAAAEDGDPHFYVDKISESRVLGAREWRVHFVAENAGAVDEDVSSWEPFESFVSSEGVTTQLIEFEEQRTGLQDTLSDDWGYPSTDPNLNGTVTDEADGFRVYHALDDDTIRKVARELGIDATSFWEQNTMRFGVGYFKATSKVRAGTQLRLPRSIDPSKRSLRNPAPPSTITSEVATKLVEATTAAEVGGSQRPADNGIPVAPAVTPPAPPPPADDVIPEANGDGQLGGQAPGQGLGMPGAPVDPLCVPDEGAIDADGPPAPPSYPPPSV